VELVSLRAYGDVARGGAPYSAAGSVWPLVE
jgi:hypothetical protein